jgi:hypothetical protein
VDPGFTFEQVEMALGAPDHTSTRTTADVTQEIWGYGSAGHPTVGFGVGVASGGPAVVGTSVGVAPGRVYYLDRVTVVFENGRVTSVERREP